MDCKGIFRFIWKLFARIWNGSRLMHDSHWLDVTAQPTSYSTCGFLLCLLDKSFCIRFLGIFVDVTFFAEKKSSFVHRNNFLLNCNNFYNTLQHTVINGELFFTSTFQCVKDIRLLQIFTHTKSPFPSAKNPPFSLTRKKSNFSIPLNS